MLVEIYTDGSANNKTKVGGVGGIILFTDSGGKIHKKEFYDGSFIETTSARMEILGLIRALELIVVKKKYPIKIHIDNQYVVNTIERGWLNNWISTGLHRTKKNMDLWFRVNDLYKEHGGKEFVELIWIRGHDGDQWNELADTLANKGRKRDKITVDRRDGKI